MLIVSGFDIRINPVTSLALDATFTRYGTDTFADNQEFKAAAKVTAAVQLRRLFNFDELRVAARYRSSGKNDLIANGVVLQELQSVPQRGDLRISYRRRVDRTLSLEVGLHGRLYDATSDDNTQSTDTKETDNQAVLDLNVAPYYQFTPAVALQTLFSYTLGTFNGIEAGVGLVVRM